MAIHTPHSRSHFHSHVDVDIDVDPCSFLVMSEAFGKDLVRMRRTARRKDRLLPGIREDGRTR